MLTAGLLAVMGAVALWSMMPGGGDLADTGAAPQIAAEQAPGAPAPAASPDTEVADTRAGTGDGQPGDGTESEAVSSAALWTGLPERPDPPSQDRIADLYIAALDPSIRPPQAVSLPDPRRIRAGDQPLAVQPSPPGPDKVFAVDDRGLVTATPEGAVTPDGLVVYAGQPDLTPPERPEDLAPPPAAAPAPEAAAEPAAEPAAEAAPPAAPAEAVIVTAGRPAVTPPPRPASLALDAAVAAALAPAASEATSEAGPEAPDPAADPAPPAEIEVTVRSGRPEIVPPARPEGRAPQPAALPEESPAAPDPAASTAEQAPADTAPQGAEAGSVALADIRPEPKAADPRPEAAADRDTALPETAILASDTETAARLAALRPRLRPAGLIPAALPVPQPEPTIRPRARPAGLAPEQAATPPAENPGQTVAEDVTAAVAEALADGAQDAESELSDIALTASIRPAARPSDFSDRVTSNAPAVPASAAATPPRTPTSASVAKQATVKNAINLGKVNLIGVYGSPSDRRALVRLPTGRYLKVKVGDRIDGGQVAAIGDDKLRYVKNGRNIVLDLPGG
jgi:hypothetical protein